MAQSKKPMSAAQLRYFGPSGQRGHQIQDKTRAANVTPPSSSLKAQGKGKK